MCLKHFSNRSTSCQASRLTYSMVWIVNETWPGNPLQILGRWQLSHRKPPWRVAVGPPEECVGYVICDNRLERPAVAIVAVNLKNLWTPLL